MPKHVILITGTPCVGKTSIAHMLTSKLDAFYVNLTQLATEENLILGKDKERDSIIVDEKRMRQIIRHIIKECSKKTIIIDGHYAVSVVPEQLATYVFVLRRDPVELRKFMEKCGFSGRKLWENLASEILDVCLVDALNVHEEVKVCELNITGKSVEEAAKEILDILGNREKCCIGVVDWLSKLEEEHLLEEYLQI
ncbi:AAA family ATPase [Candidatus Bathyarchaeota archaeon]|nr:AAA family ATPase [Candidatus Bathyarchaeota archaeon]